MKKRIGRGYPLKHHDEHVWIEKITFENNGIVPSLIGSEAFHFRAITAIISHRYKWNRPILTNSSAFACKT